jgi:integrase
MATVRFRLNHPSKPGERSIQVELYINRDIKPEIATGEKILAKHWTGSRANSKAPDYHRLNDNLSRIERELTQLWRDNLDDLSKIKSLMPAVVRGSSSTSQKKTIFEALEKFLSECETGKGANTLKMYNSLQKKLIAFDAIYPIDFNSLDFNFYDRFKRFLYEQPNPNYREYNLFLADSKDHYILGRRGSGGLPVGLFDDTVYKYFTNLKAFISWAEKRGYQTNQSHKTWEIIKRKHPPISLTLDELHLLSNQELPNHLDIARDYLLLECYTGQRISDIRRFNANDYHDYKWTHRPKKGNRLSSKEVTVHFKGYSAPALLILGKYNFKLPSIHEVTLNKNIKTACEKAGICDRVYTERWAGNRKIRISGSKYEFISTHTGRKTFITLALSHGMPVEYVMELTGISEYQTLSHYRAKFEDKSIEQYLKGVEDSISLLRKSS